jgi:hypothetical protein
MRKAAPLYRSRLRHVQREAIHKPQPQFIALCPIDDGELPVEATNSKLP